MHNQVHSSVICIHICTWYLLEPPVATCAVCTIRILKNETSFNKFNVNNNDNQYTLFVSARDDLIDTFLYFFIVVRIHSVRRGCFWKMYEWDCALPFFFYETCTLYTRVQSSYVFYTCLLLWRTIHFCYKKVKEQST